jgi:hypothetical protein
MEMSKEMREEGLAENLERQAEFYDRVVDWVHANGLPDMRSCIANTDEVPELVIAAAVNSIIRELGLPLELAEAMSAAVGPFMIGFYIGRMQKVQ